MGPIQQCRNGHLLCAACRKKVVRCPTCRIEPPWSRCLTLERLSEMVTVTCPIPACCLRFWPKDLEAHKKVCEFMPIKCPYFSCIARLPMVPENISQHLVAEHGATRNGTEPPLGVRTPRRSSHMFTSQLTLPLPTAGTAGNGASGPTIQIISALRSQFIMW